MALKRLTLATIADIDGGRTRILFDRMLDQVKRDCQDRPGVRAPRKLRLTVNVAPAKESDGADVEVSFEVTEILPKRASRTFSMDASRGGLYWNEASPDDAKQRTLDEAGMKPRPVAAGPEVDDDEDAEKE